MTGVAAHNRSDRPSPSRRRPILAAAFAVVLAAAFASACAPSAPEPGNAELDREYTQIVLPVDKYGMDWREADRVRHAEQVFADRCMRKLGASNPEAGAWAPGAPPTPEFRYGRWNAEYIATFGFEGKPWPQGVAAHRKTEAMLEKHPDLYDDLIQCSKSAQLFVVEAGTEYEGRPPSPVFVASDDSYLKTRKDPRAQAVWQEVAECTTSKGYDTEIEDGYAVLQYVDGWSEEQIRQAEVAKAACDDELDATQRIGDIEAGYQLEYIAQHEAEFAAVRAEVDATLARADEIIKNNG